MSLVTSILFAFLAIAVVVTIHHLIKRFWLASLISALLWTVALSFALEEHMGKRWSLHYLMIAAYIFSIWFVYSVLVGFIVSWVKKIRARKNTT